MCFVFLKCAIKWIYSCLTIFVRFFIFYFLFWKKKKKVTKRLKNKKLKTEIVQGDRVHNISLYSFFFFFFACCDCVHFAICLFLPNRFEYVWIKLKNKNKKRYSLSEAFIKLKEKSLCHPFIERWISHLATEDVGDSNSNSKSKATKMTRKEQNRKKKVNTNIITSTVFIQTTISNDFFLLFFFFHLSAVLLFIVFLRIFNKYILLSFNFLFSVVMNEISVYSFFKNLLFYRWNWQHHKSFKGLHHKPIANLEDKNPFLSSFFFCSKKGKIFELNLPLGREKNYRNSLRKFYVFFVLFRVCGRGEPLLFDEKINVRLTQQQQQKNKK